MSGLIAPGLLGGVQSVTARAEEASTQLGRRLWRQTEFTPALAGSASTAGPLAYVGATIPWPANTSLNTIVNVTGSGILLNCFVDFLLNSVGRTLSVILTVDGDELINYNSGPLSTNYRIDLVGSLLPWSAIPYVRNRPLHYSSSLMIQVQQTATASGPTLWYTNLLAAPYGG